VVVVTQLSIPIKEGGVLRAKRLVALLGVDGSVRCNARDALRHVLGLPADTGNHAAILAVGRKLPNLRIRDARLLGQYNTACGVRPQSNPIVHDHAAFLQWLNVAVQNYAGADELQLAKDRQQAWVHAVDQVRWVSKCCAAWVLYWGLPLWCVYIGVYTGDCFMVWSWYLSYMLHGLLSLSLFPTHFMSCFVWVAGWMVGLVTMPCSALQVCLCSCRHALLKSKGGLAWNGRIHSALATPISSLCR
jgi:hypothetical protein